MKLSWEQLYRLPVITELGTKLGIIVGIDVDGEAHSITHYHVKPGNILSSLLSKDLLISPEQVIDISERQMTVNESSIPVKARTTNKNTRLTLATAKPEIDLREAE